MRKNKTKKKETKNQAQEHAKKNGNETSEEQIVEKEEMKENQIADEPKDDSRKELDDLTELKDKYIRLMAEFENFRKRTIREKMELINSAAEGTISDLLPVLDDFDRAKKSADDENTNEVFSEGVSLVYEKLYKVLQSKGLKEIESNGSDFDVELHEAITEIPAPTEDMKGKVVDTIEKGYKLNDKIIRHAKVVVGM